MLLLSLGCLPDLFGPDPLDPDEVTSIPAGTASGDDFAGEYDVEIYTEGCEGECGPITMSFWTVSFCDVGDRDSEWLEVRQSDGELEVELSDDISYYTGGVDADGSMEIGGYATEYGGDVELVARVEGRFEGDELVATAQSRIWGTVEDVELDCYGSYRIEGAWYGELSE